MFRIFLAAALLAAPVAAHAEWHEASTKHFVILSDDKPEQLAAFARSLERYDKAMRLFRNIPDREIAPVDRVTVFVLRSVSDIEVLRGEGVAGFYMPRAGNSVAFTARLGSRPNPGSRARVREELMLDPQSVLRHEYAHHFMFNNWQTAALPFWLVEGFAEFHATAEERPDGSVLFGRVPTYRAVNLVYSDGCTVKRILSTSEFSKLGSCVITDLYAYGWLAVHYLTFTKGGPEKMAAYVLAINRGEPLEKAALAFGDLNAFQADVTKYLNRPTRTAYTVPAASLKVDEPVIRKLRPGEAATMSVRIRSNAGVTKRGAGGVYESAARAAAAYPDDPAAQLVLAEAAFDAEKYDAAQQAAARALKAEPKATKAMVYMGMAKMEVAFDAKSKDPATWREIRRWFLNANKSDPYDAEPLILYYRSFVMADEAATDNAEQGLLQAVDFAPQDGRLRFVAAYVHLTNGDGAAARSALEVIAYNPHGGGAAKFASKLVDLIDKGNPGAAMAKLAPRIKDPNYEDEDDKGD